MPPYVDPVLNDILSQIQFGHGTNNQITGNDLTLLSAISYLPLPSVSSDPFSFTSQQLAVNAILSSLDLQSASSSTATTSSSGPKASINPTIADAIVKILLQGNTQSYLAASGSAGFIGYTPTANYNFVPFAIGARVNPNALTVSNIAEGFYQVGSAIFLQLLCARINLQSTPGSSNAYGITKTVTPVSPINPSNANAPTFQDVIDLTRYAVAQAFGIDLDTPNLKNRMNQLKVQKESFQAWGVSQAAQYLASEPLQQNSASQRERLQIYNISQIASNAFQYVIGVLNLTNTSIINNPETIQALLTFGLGPWLVMVSITSFQNARNSFVTQAYSRIAVFYSAMIAFTNLSTSASSSSSSSTPPLGEVVTAIQSLLNASFMQEDSTGPIADVLELSGQNNATASELALQNQSLQNRVGIASDLQTTYEYESRIADTQRSIFYVWLVAFLIVFVTSIVLIVTDKIDIFLPFAYGILLLIAVTYLLSWAVKWLYRNSYID